MLQDTDMLVAVLKFARGTSKRAVAQIILIMCVLGWVSAADGN